MKERHKTLNDEDVVDFIRMTKTETVKSPPRSMHVMVRPLFAGQSSDIGAKT